MGNIIDPRGKVLKSKWKQQQEETAWRPMLGLGFCRVCGFEFKIVMAEPVNVFRIPCQSESCDARKSFVSIVPREFWPNFMPKPPDQPPPVPPKEAA